MIVVGVWTLHGHAAHLVAAVVVFYLEPQYVAGLVTLPLMHGLAYGLDMLDEAEVAAILCHLVQYDAEIVGIDQQYTWLELLDDLHLFSHVHCSWHAYAATSLPYVSYGLSPVGILAILEDVSTYAQQLVTKVTPSPEMVSDSMCCPVQRIYLCLAYLHWFASAAAGSRLTWLSVALRHVLAVEAVTSTLNVQAF